MIKVTIPSQLGYEKVAMMGVACLARMIGLPSERIEDLKTIIGEAVTNAIEHGNQSNTDLMVQVVAAVQGKVLVLNVIDEGQRPLPVPLPIEQIRTDHRGMGFFLISSLADEVIPRVFPGRNDLEMIVHLGG